ncbi:CUB and sushi domain-containing protein 3 [Nymphon striatum]|nr:CUB and sushi domain-containing protein 3 [Nymphon striatum]
MVDHITGSVFLSLIGGYRVSLANEIASTTLNACGIPSKFESHYPKVSRSKEVYEVGAKVEYVCKTGYAYREGNGDATCIERNGEQVWDGPTLMCRPKTCPSPPSIENGKITGTLYTFSAGIIYSCNKGYEPSTTVLTRYCLATGRWSGRIPECNPVSCPVPTNPANGVADYGAITFGQTVTYSCESPLGVDGPRTRTCMADKTWSGSQPTCEGTIVNHF